MTRKKNNEKMHTTTVDSTKVQTFFVNKQHYYSVM